MKNKENIVIFALGIAKLIIHFLTNTNYHLHRDEFLYFDQGKHLGWGYYEVPPFTPFIGSLADLLGGSVFAIRLFPALAGALIIMLACKLAKDLGGGLWAIGITGLSLLLTPALLGSNTLFQPVSFNQMFWFLIAYCAVQLIISQWNKYYYILGILIGLALLTKYSVVFYLVALAGGILLTEQRKRLPNKRMIALLGLGFIIALPNLLWQINNDWPLIDHMKELNSKQLVHMDWFIYLKSQFIFHKGFTLIWIFGLIGLFTIKKLKDFKFIGIAFLFTILLIGGLHGKSYYTLGAFLILFPFGGLAIENLLHSAWSKVLLVSLMVLTTLPFYPLSLPMLKADKLKKYCNYLSESYGIDYMLRWEDGKYYDLPQDAADMYGWEQLTQKTAKIYHDLPKGSKEKCMIYGGSYGHAGSINYFRSKYDLPEAYSLNGSYILWANPDVDFTNQIMVDDQKQDSSQWFGKMTLVDSIQHPYAREKGYIYYRSEPKIDVRERWKERVGERHNRE